jgi:hypothetical protein
MRTLKFSQLSNRRGYHWNLVVLPNAALLRAIVSSAYVKQNMGIRSGETLKSILMYLVPKPFDQIRSLTAQTRPLRSETGQLATT